MKHLNVFKKATRALSWWKAAMSFRTGDFVTVDFEGTIAGKPFAGGKGENYVIEVGAGQTLPEFEEAVIGFTSGQAAIGSGDLSG